MNSQSYSTEPFKKRCRQACVLYCVMQESTQCDLALLFPYPQREWCGKNKPFPFLFCLAEAEWKPSRLLPSQPRSCSLPVSSGPEGRGKGWKQDSRCCFAFLSSCVNKTCLASQVGAVVHMLFIHQEPQKLLLHSVTFTPHPWTSFSSQWLHLETLRYDIAYTKGLG